MTNDAVIYGIIIAACAIYTLGSLLLFFFARRTFLLAMAGVFSVGVFFMGRVAFLAVEDRAFGTAALFMVPVLIGSLAIIRFFRLASQRVVVQTPAPPNSADGPNA